MNPNERTLELDKILEPPTTSPENKLATYSHRRIWL